jgi:thiol-disulfide isomerase/thioredoxin
MKSRILAAVIALSLWVPANGVLGADPTPPADELKSLITKIQTKLREGKRTEADLGDEIKEFDVLLAKHKNEKTDEAAQILLMKAMLYLEVFENTEKGVELVQQMKKDYPDTKPGKDADGILENVKRQGESVKIRKSLVAGSKFPDFEEKDLAGKPLSIANYKGKVVLVDFWATWCGPCVKELPNVIKAYEKYHDKGFEIIGVSLDEDEQKLKTFIKDKNMTWVQYFDGKGWANKLAGKYGVQSIPSTYLLDGEGKIIGSNLRGEALDAAVAKALPKS